MRYVWLAFLAIAVSMFLFTNTYTTEPVTTGALETRFAELRMATSNSCGLTEHPIGAMNDNSRIQGSCCGPMDYHRYAEQIDGLKKYEGIDVIPDDPYDISVTLAKQLFSYQSIELSPEQQNVYDQAAQLSHEGGPCCCRCWRWDAFDGQAKYLITEYDFSAEQVAEVWDLEDGCGGPGHAHTEDH